MYYYIVLDSTKRTLLRSRLFLQVRAIRFWKLLDFSFNKVLGLSYTASSSKNITQKYHESLSNELQFLMTVQQLYE
ncbi:hypothetical protein V3C99_000530 [Haemonchus contortus]